MTTRFSLRLPQHEAHLLSLAVAYHLSRPGAEINPQTLAEWSHGLAELPAVLEPQLESPVAAIDLKSLQVVLLANALSALISELKMYPTFDAMTGPVNRPRSVAPGFDERLRSLFPQVIEDPSFALELAQDAIVLRRQLPLTRAREIIEEERKAAPSAPKKRWQFWKR